MYFLTLHMLYFIRMTFHGYGQRRIQDFHIHLRWSTLQPQLTVLSHKLFLQAVPSCRFKGVLETSLSANSTQIRSKIIHVYSYKTSLQKKKKIFTETWLKNSLKVLNTTWFFFFFSIESFSMILMNLLTFYFRDKRTE